LEKAGWVGKNLHTKSVRKTLAMPIHKAIVQAM
jgi:hypothetical protein